MSIELKVLEGVSVYEEPAGSFEVDHSGTPNDFLRVPAKEDGVQATWGYEQLAVSATTAEIDDWVPDVLGAQRCTAQLATVLHSHGVPLTGNHTNPTVSTWAQLRMLKAIMGGVSSTATEAADTEVQSGTTTTVINVTTGHGDRFTPGQMIACTVSSGASWVEVRPVESVATDAVTVRYPFSATPVTGTDVRGSITAYLTQDPDTSLQLLLQGKESDDYFCLRGLQGGFSVSTAVGALPEITYSLAGAGWSQVSGGSGVAGATFSTLFSPPVVNASEFHFGDYDGGARNIVQYSAITIEPSIAYSMVKSGAATNGVTRHVRQAGRPVITYSFTTPFEDDDFWDDRVNRTMKEGMLQVGRIPGEIVAFEMPRGQIVDVQKGASDEGVMGQTVKVKCRHDALIGSSTDLQKSAFRIHFL